MYTYNLACIDLMLRKKNDIIMAISIDYASVSLVDAGDTWSHDLQHTFCMQIPSLVTGNIFLRKT